MLNRSEAAKVDATTAYRADQARAAAFRRKVLAAIDEQGIPPEIRYNIEPELLLAALLLGVKE